MKAIELIEALAKKLETNSQTELARVLGISLNTLSNWKRQDENLSPQQVATALAKSQAAAVSRAQIETIKPIVEFYRIEKRPTKSETRWQIFDGGKDAIWYAQGLKKELNTYGGIYIFYDSRGRALYVGKAKEQSLWEEMNQAFNRRRGVQKIALVQHPELNKEFKPGYEKLRQPRDTLLELSDLAAYFSAYYVDDGMINDLEALMVRGFANDLLNVRMETFAHSRG